MPRRLVLISTSTVFGTRYLEHAYPELRDAFGGISRVLFIPHALQDRDGYEPEFAWWARKPWQALDAALDGYSKFLREKVAGQTEDDKGPLVGDPIGAKALREALDAEYIPYTPAEILAIAERELTLRTIAATLPAPLVSTDAIRGPGVVWKWPSATLGALWMP